MCELETQLKELRLPSICASYHERADEARQESLSYEEYLQTLVTGEIELRHENRTDRWLRQSRLPLEKSLETFDQSRLPAKVRRSLKTLLEGQFLEHAENVLAFGNPGSGKTHLLCAVAQELVHRGHRVLFQSCNLLVQDLLAAKQDLSLGKVLKSLRRFDAIIIDDIGYVQQDRAEMEVLFALLADRYENRSVMITSNLPFSKWEVIFKDPMTTAAAIDRLVHHSIIIELNMPSYRLEAAKSKKEVASQKK